MAEKTSEFPSESGRAPGEILREMWRTETSVPDWTREELGEGFDTRTAEDIKNYRRRPENIPHGPAPQPGVFGQFPEDMTWVHFDSSNVDQAAYDWEREDLYVQFLSGALYVYRAVPPQIWDDFQNSNSKGMFVWYILRGDGADNVYAYDCIRSGQRESGVGENKVNKVTPISRMSEIRSGRR